MHAFFQKYPVELKESTAIKMMHKKIEEAEDKCKAKDETYVKDLAKVYEMLEMFFEEKGINPATFI